MTTSRCSHLPEVLPDCTSSAAPMVKTVEDCSSLVNGQPQYVMQVSAKDGQLLSTVVRTLATQSPFNDRPMCRICHEGSSQEDLLSPCECTGTLGTIHRSCLEHWLSSSNTTYCELCHFRFAVERKPRPLVEWLRNPGPQHEKRTLFGDMVCFLFITPLATISGWLCLRGAVDHLHFSSRLEAVGLIALTVALFTIYLFWTLVQLIRQSEKEGHSSNKGSRARAEQSWSSGQAGGVGGSNQSPRLNGGDSLAKSKPWINWYNGII
ncbi:E3 ubiquitin-protein ligase MARCHF3 isoform X1 [Hemicordylus capensis]|uniref:E3 ubiquitin-protein ligase MARCHF3 isoform X1 n=1 Tax=Hemicordylus capensis TaxID=884348 RepID=UPI0023028FFD|nr:E3 ubiquitin-protein ligase MARCHF3 isoform X1 [Hemicordylus capensis]XP_053148210.1 E3 ubiquitin-protein ligase MARCHF3 isoform X1 [Hemicordylus capensis]XP_053148211.1 E3 ubiquitin-protein ligase MARCHF3 isoform X1 [Hemicordylus capensis]XP_053148212.1 E3 ubiquitin-protein ligase MARCHF3 isoform X1 [Hemicordylus capensis]XP_053148213.1 E3 ubiquitin-protein ligase MARCHF3 isoform X1 [Hemicordylus capensis]